MRLLRVHFDRGMMERAELLIDGEIAWSSESVYAYDVRFPHRLRRPDYEGAGASRPAHATLILDEEPAAIPVGHEIDVQFDDDGACSWEVSFDVDDVENVGEVRRPISEPEPDRRHPMQPIELDEYGVARFRPNAIVKWMVDTGRVDLNAIAMIVDFPDEDREQFAQLMGYSVSGFGDLSYASDQVVEEADAEVARLAGKVRP